MCDLYQHVYKKKSIERWNARSPDALSQLLLLAPFMLFVRQVYEGLGQLHQSQTSKFPPQNAELVSEGKVICILPHCGLKARNTDSDLALLVLALAFKEERAVQPGLLTFTVVHVCESGNH